MTKSIKILEQIPAFCGRAHVWAVIETPKACANKYKYMPQMNAFALKKVLPEGMAFPENFGFIPSTRGEDGDPLDILVLTNEALVSGSVVEVRLLGVLKARQCQLPLPESGKQVKPKWVRNDRFIAVAAFDHRHAHVKTLLDLPPHLMDEFKSFFVTYMAREGKQFELLGVGDGAEAMKLVRAASN